MVHTPEPHTPADRQVIKDEAEATKREEARKHEAALKEKKGPWVADLLDPAYPPCHEKNRGNEGYKPWFDGEANSEAGVKATRVMAAGDFKLPEGAYDNVTGNGAFSAPNALNPVWRWDDRGPQNQWVRP